MRIRRNLLLSWEILAAHKLRTLLSVMGIIIGVAAVVLIVSMGRGAEERILGRIRTMGTNLVIVRAGQVRLIAGRQRQMNTVRTLVPSDAWAIAEECPSVASAAAAIDRNMPVKWGAGSIVTRVVGMNEEGFRIRNITTPSGHPFDSQEERAARRVAVLGHTVARDLFGDADPLGLQVRIRRVPFEVIGVAAPKGVDVNGRDQDDVIFVPLRTAMRRLFNVTHIQAIYVQARDAQASKLAEEEARNLLRQRHRLRDKPDDFTIQNQVTLLETEREMSRSMALLISSVAATSLLVGGIGILAVMLISVRQRRREIGLRRAVGALRRDIRNQFLAEAGLIAGAGGVLGVTLGVCAALAMSGLGYWEAVISWPAGAVAFVFSVSLGMVFGIYPAMRAAHLEPIQALRAE